MNKFIFNDYFHEPQKEIAKQMIFYGYSLDDTKKVERKLAALLKIGLSARAVDSIPLPFSIAGAIRFSNQA